MAPLPKRRHSSARQSKRSRALLKSRFTLTKCKNCGTPTPPHHICQKCGFYQGKQFLTIKTAANKK